MRRVLIQHNPNEGLKPPPGSALPLCAAVLIQHNPNEGLKPTVITSFQSSSSVLIQHNPNEGLKHDSNRRQRRAHLRVV